MIDAAVVLGWFLGGFFLSVVVAFLWEASRS